MAENKTVKSTITIEFGDDKKTKTKEIRVKASSTRNRERAYALNGEYSDAIIDVHAEASSAARIAMGLYDEEELDDGDKVKQSPIEKAKATKDVNQEVTKLRLMTDSLQREYGVKMLQCFFDFEYKDIPDATLALLKTPLMTKNETEGEEDVVSEVWTNVSTDVYADIIACFQGRFIIR